MKKFVCIISSILLSMTALSGCNRGNTETSSPSQSSVQIQENSTQSSVSENTEISVSVQESSEELQESSEEPTESSLPVPEGVTESGSKLRYTNSVLSLSVTFPREFCIINGDYTPLYGIYLRNIDGTATLLMESVEDTTTAPSDLADYLSEKYPDSEVYITDYREIVCKRQATDRAGNEVISFVKIKTKDGGYNEILLTCSIEDKEKFEPIFNQIAFS